MGRVDIGDEGPLKELLGRCGLYLPPLMPDLISLLSPHKLSPRRQDAEIYK